MFLRRLNFVCLRFGTLCQFHLHRLPWRWKRQCSETSTHKSHSLGNHQKGRIQHLEYGESFKSRIVWVANVTFCSVCLTVQLSWDDLKNRKVSRLTSLILKTNCPYWWDCTVLHFRFYKLQVTYFRTKCGSHRKCHVLRDSNWMTVGEDGEHTDHGMVFGS